MNELKNYLIDCIGYSEEDIQEYEQDAINLIDLLEPEQLQEYKLYIRG